MRALPESVVCTFGWSGRRGRALGTPASASLALAGLLRSFLLIALLLCGSLLTTK